MPVFSTLVKKLDPYMVPLITVLCFLGVYLMNYSLFEIGVMIFFGIFGYFMRKCGFPLAPLILAVILGPLMEKFSVNPCLLQAMITLYFLLDQFH